jgi:hypothetical protein
MKTRLIFRIFLVLAIVFVVLAAAVPAYAEARGKLTVTIVDVTGPVLVPTTDPGNPCNIDLTYHNDGYLRVMTWTNDAGQVTHEADIYGTFKQYVSGANDNTINIQEQGPIHTTVNWTTGVATVQFLGTALLYTIPHYGRINGTVGQTKIISYWDVTTDPPTFLRAEVHQSGFTIPDHSDVICSYLGGALK